MTEEQHRLLMQFASALRSTLYAYEDEYGAINQDDPISEIVAAGANLIHIVDSLEPLYSPHGDTPF